MILFDFFEILNVGCVEIVDIAILSCLIFLSKIWISKSLIFFPSKVHIWTSQVTFSVKKSIYGPYEPPISGRIPYIWTSMPIISQSKAYYWTSMSIISQSKAYYWTSMPIISQSKADYWTSTSIISQSETYYWTSRSISFARKSIYGPQGP